jgi:uroporphyrinogen decarboxylase
MLNSRDKVRALLNNKPADRVGFWIGNPADETRKIYYNYYGIKEDMGEKIEGSVALASKSGKGDLKLALKLGSDLMWYSPELDPLAWQHPEGKPIFDTTGGKKRESLSQAGVFADCEDSKEVENFEWPDPDYLDFSSTIADIEEAAVSNMAIFGGMWMPFFHVIADFFGMDNYFIKMYTNPEIVDAVTERVVNFYLEANKRCLDLMANKLDAVFFGNDFGSQDDLLISPQAFDRFILPSIKRIIEQVKSYNLKVVVHSCGAISRIIPRLIDAGIDGLHPLQAKAKGMEATKLAKEFKNGLVFIGGVDTQELLPYGSPEEVKKEVMRLKKVFGERYIVSPSHEALLPNVSIENVIAMREAVDE